MGQPYFQNETDSVGVTRTYTVVEGIVISPNGDEVWRTNKDGVIVGYDNLKTSAIAVTLDGAGSAITTGIKGYLLVPFDGIISEVTLLADQSGSIVVDIWKDVYANYPPTDADSITSATPPTISSALKAQDTTLTGWTTTLTAGDVLGFNVDSITTVTRVHVILKVIKT